METETLLKIQSHVERIARFNDNLQPFDYKRLYTYALALAEATKEI